MSYRKESITNRFLSAHEVTPARILQEWGQTPLGMCLIPKEPCDALNQQQQGGEGLPVTPLPSSPHAQSFAFHQELLGSWKCHVSLTATPWSCRNGIEIPRLCCGAPPGWHCWLQALLAPGRCCPGGREVSHVKVSEHLSRV